MPLQWSDDEFPVYSWYHLRNGVREDPRTYNSVKNIEYASANERPAEMWDIAERSARTPAWDVIVDWSY